MTLKFETDMDVRLCLIVFLGCFIGNIHAAANSESLMRLTSILLDGNNYKSTVRPVPSGGAVINATHDLTLLKVTSLEDQVLTLTTWIQMEWQDDRLTWTPGMHDDIEEIRIPSRLLWLPDIVLYNSVDEQRSFGSDINAIVTYKGEVTYIPPTITRTSCRVKAKTMKPKHKVVCNLKFGSWTYDMGILDLHNGHGEMDINSYVPSTDWKVVQTSVKRNVAQYACCPEKYVSLEYLIMMKYMGK